MYIQIDIEKEKGSTLIYSNPSRNRSGTTYIYNLWSRAEQSKRLDWRLFYHPWTVCLIINRLTECKRSERGRFGVSACYVILFLPSKRPVLSLIFHLFTEGVPPCRVENGLICYNEIGWTSDCQSKYTQLKINLQFTTEIIITRDISRINSVIAKSFIRTCIKALQCKHFNKVAKYNSSSLMYSTKFSCQKNDRYWGELNNCNLTFGMTCNSI